MDKKEKQHSASALKQGLAGRDLRLDGVRGFAILIVMIHHAISLNGLVDPYINDAIVAVQMPLFMMVSGYLAGCGADAWSLERHNGLARLPRRTVSYLVPFFAWLVLTHVQHPMAELKLQLFALDRGLWFLMTLWMVTVIAAVATQLATVLTRVLPFVPLHALIFLGFSGLCYVGFVLQARSGFLLLSPSLMVTYMPFYIAGFAYAAYLKTPYEASTLITKRLMVQVLWGFSLIAFIYLVACTSMTLTETTTDALMHMVASFFGSFVAFYGIYTFASGRLQKCLAFLGTYTLEIYVLHFRFARWLPMPEGVSSLYSLQGVAYVLAVLALMSVLTAACIFVIKKVWVLDFLLFGKIKKKKYSPKER